MNYYISFLKVVFLLCKFNPQIVIYERNYAVMKVILLYFDLMEKFKQFLQLYNNIDLNIMRSIVCKCPATAKVVVPWFSSYVVSPVEDSTLLLRNYPYYVCYKIYISIYILLPDVIQLFSLC